MLFANEAFAWFKSVLKYSSEIIFKQFIWQIKKKSGPFYSTLFLTEPRLENKLLLLVLFLVLFLYFWSGITNAWLNSCKTKNSFQRLFSHFWIRIPANKQLNQVLKGSSFCWEQVILYIRIIIIWILINNDRKEQLWSNCVKKTKSEFFLSFFLFLSFYLQRDDK